MLQFFEKLILLFIQWFYTLPIFFGLITLGVLGAVLFAVQFMKRGYTIIPGVLGLIIIFAELYHIFDRESIVELTNTILRAMDSPSQAHPIPIIEFIFHIFVAPAEYRFVFEEFLFVTLVLYFSSVIFHGFKEYQKTGIVLGEFSLTSFFNQEAKRPERSDSNELGSGDLANTQQISPWTKPSGDEGDTSLEVTDLRGSDGVSFKQAQLVMPREERNRHVLVIAKTGSGKTTKLILPVLYNDCLCKVRSTIVIDSKPEMWPKLANFTRKHNPDKNVMLFNPLDTARSLSWNILGKIENDTDAKLIANTVIMATDQPSAKSDSPFFRNNALSILNAVMVGLLHDP